ncbi:MAG: S8 family serine peptidase [Deltaproteobacteria bacterium]|nr:S8 family serine peptidase [Deltaproteobacteria bacterium]
MRTKALLASLTVLLSAACGDAARSHTGEVQAPLGVEPEALELWQLMLVGGPAADAWLSAPPEQRVARSRSRLAELDAQHAEVRPLVEAHAEIVGELRRVANGWLVLATPSEAERLARLPDVASIERAPIFGPSLARALPRVEAPSAWTGADGVTGSGVTVGIIDSGVDYFHADFGGPGTVQAYDGNDPTLVEPGSFPTARVVGGWDFAGDDYDATTPGKAKPKPDADPIDCKGGNGEYSGGHGTHVAGVAAGNGVTASGAPYSGPYDVTLALDGLAIAPGVAPEASIVALRVFGCGGSTGLVPLALERAADPNEDGDFADRLDVLNLSLGSSYGLGASTELAGMKKLDELGAVLVVAMGNDGDTFFDGGAPGTLPMALTVAASELRAWVPLEVEAPAAIAGSYPAAEGPISRPLAETGNVSGELVAAVPADACGVLMNATELDGKIAVIQRGTCPFVSKLARAKGAGALAAIIVDDEVSSEPPVMGGESKVDLPAVAIRKADGALLAGELMNGVTVTLPAGKLYDGPGTEGIAGFSSRGPTPADLALKPDVSAPGAAIRSAGVGSGSGDAVMGGTSMACPVVAGTAALVRERHPDLAPVGVKSRLVNSAATLRASDGTPFALTRQGSGRIALKGALAATTLARAEGSQSAAALSFGALVTHDAASLTRTAIVENQGAEPVTFALSLERVDALPGVTMSLGATSLTVPTGGAATFDLTLTLAPEVLGDPPPDALTSPLIFEYPRHYLNEAMGFVWLDGGPTGTLKLPYHGVVRAAAERQAATPVACEAQGLGGDVRIPIDGPSAHPAPVVTAFELGVVDEVNPKSAENPAIARIDLRAVGVASDLAVKSDVGETTVMFGLATEGPWGTPAEGPFSPIGIAIDSDGDDGFEFVIRAAPFTGEKPHLDVLVAEIFNAKGERVGERRYLNLAPADVADTSPFVNDVLVLPVYARDIGLTSEQTSFRYLAFGDRLETPMFDDTTEWIGFDLTKPRVDTAVLAPTVGRPIHVGASSVPVRVTPFLGADEAPPSVLLLHHTNVPGKRWEAVSLGERVAEGLVVAVDERPADDGRVVRKATVTNQGGRAIEGITLTGTLEGGTFELLAPSQGSCAATTLSCTLGTIEVGSAATVTMVIEATGDVALDLQATTKNGCVTPLAAAIPRRDVGPRTALDATGGCSCSVGQATGQDAAAWLVATAAALVGVARRRPRR